MDEEYRIDPNDPIEKLVVKSVQLGEEVAKAMQNGFSPSEYEVLVAKEQESERLWEEAKRLGRPTVTQKNYEDLANAIIKRAVDDYEDLMCETVYPGAIINWESIIGFLSEQTFVRLDMMEQIDIIRNVYNYKFIPYVKKHTKEIEQEWKKFDKQNIPIDERVKYTHHHCPLCRGVLRPMHRKTDTGIGCTGCHLIYYIPVEVKEDKRCLKSVTVASTPKSAKS